MPRGICSMHLCIQLEMLNKISALTQQQTYYSTTHHHSTLLLQTIIVVQSSKRYELSLNYYVALITVHLNYSIPANILLHCLYTFSFLSCNSEILVSSCAFSFCSCSFSSRSFSVTSFIPS